MRKPKYPPHKYSKELKSLCVSLIRTRIHNNEEATVTVAELAKRKGYPSPSTLYRWVRKFLDGTLERESTTPKGPPPKLSKEEKLVIGGFVIHCNERYEPVSSDKIKSFVLDNFHEDISKSMVSNIMKELKLTVHRASKKRKKYKLHVRPRELLKWLKETRLEIEQLDTLSRLVVVDTVRFTNVQCILRTYSPEGGGEPTLWDESWQYTTILYVGLCGDGTVLPAIVFSNCDSIPKDITEGYSAKVLYIPSLSAPSADLTLRWLTEVQEHLRDKPLVLHDRGTEFKNKIIDEWWTDMSITHRLFPVTAGAFVNPCDNAFNAQLKYTYAKLPKRTYADKLRAILQAYYTPTEDAVKHYFKKSALLDQKLTLAFTNNLLSEGWHAGKKHQELYDECRDMYRSWEHHLRLAVAGESLERHTHPTGAAWHVKRVQHSE